MYKTLEDYVGNTPLVRLKRLPGAAVLDTGGLAAHSPWMQLWHNARRWVG